MKTLTIALSLLLTTAMPAYAGLLFVPPLVVVPEPSMIGLFAGGVMAIVIAYRLRNRK